MIFREWLKSTKLPNTAQIHLSDTLSGKLINQLMSQSDGEQILLDAIDEINNGSRKSVNDCRTKIKKTTVSLFF